MLVCTELTGKTTIRSKPKFAPRRILNQLTNQIGVTGYTTYICVDMYIIR